MSVLKCINELAQTKNLYGLTARYYPHDEKLALQFLEEINVQMLRNPEHLQNLFGADLFRTIKRHFEKNILMLI